MMILFIWKFAVFMRRFQAGPEMVLNEIALLK